MQHKCQQSAPSRSTGRARTEEVTSLISIQLPGVVFCRANQSLAQHGKLSHHPAAAVVTAAASLITTRKLFAGKVIWRHSQSCMLRPAVPVTSGHTKSRYGRFALPAYVYLSVRRNVVEALFSDRESMLQLLACTCRRQCSRSFGPC